MCGRFSLFHNAEEIRRRFKLRKWFREWLKRYNIAPQQQILIVYSQDGERTAQEVEWGLIPHWAKTPKPVINARAESIKELPTFRDSFNNKRCLIVADGFYEWQKQGHTKQPYRITLKGGGLFAFAGLYDDWQGKRTATIITTKPNTLMRPIHDRMPAILRPEEEDSWLTNQASEALIRLLQPYPDQAMSTTQISTKINDTTNEGPNTIEQQKLTQQTLT